MGRRMDSAPMKQKNYLCIYQSIAEEGVMLVIDQALTTSNCNLKRRSGSLVATNLCRWPIVDSVREVDPDQVSQ